MHARRHDNHIAILMGVADVLASVRGGVRALTHLVLDYMTARRGAAGNDPRPPGAPSWTGASGHGRMTATGRRTERPPGACPGHGRVTADRRHRTGIVRIVNGTHHG